MSVSAPRLIISNTLAQLLAKGIGVALTFVSTVLIIRLGGTSLFGELTKVFALVAIGFTIIDFGLNAHAVRTMHGPVHVQRQILADTLLARLLLSLLVILVLNLLVLLLPGGYSGEVKRFFWLGSLALLPQGLYTSANAWFQRHLSYWRSSLAVILGTSLGTLLTITFTFLHPTLPLLVLSSTAGYLMIGFTALFLLRHDLPKKYSLPRSFIHLRSSLVLGLILLFSVLASKVDTVLLGIFRTSSEVGEYGFAYRIFDVLLVLPAFVMNSVYPLLVAGDASQKKRLLHSSSFSLLLLGSLAAILVILLAPLLYFVKPGLELSVLSLRLLSISLPLFYLTPPLMWQLIEARLERPLLLLYLLASLFNTGLNLLGIPPYGVVAASLITGITEIFIYLGLLYIRKLYVSRN